MTLYQHRFHGSLPAGDEFVFSWWANSVRNLASAQAAAVGWILDFMEGANGLFTKTTAGVVINRVSTGEINPATGRQQALADDVVASPGAAAGSSLPQEVALVVSLRTTLANRSGRGRFYLPCLAASQLTATGKVPAATITDLLDRLDDAWSLYNTLNDRPVVYSRTLRATRNVTSYDIGDVYDVQTRRDNKVPQARDARSMA